MQRRRADAQRSIAAILDAAVAVLGERPDASVEEIATAAGVARQTVYAHYPSREALLTAVLDRALAESASAIDAAEPDRGAPLAALERLVAAGWQTLERHARLLESLHGGLTPEQLHGLHAPILERLERLVRRGQRARAFDPTPSPTWHVAAVLGLLHAAAQEVGAGRMSADEAAAALRATVARAVGATR